MVEEFMLLGNISVAEKILKEFPDCALLRRHPAPPVNNYEPIVKVAEAKVCYQALLVYHATTVFLETGLLYVVSEYWLVCRG